MNKKKRRNKREEKIIEDMVKEVLECPFCSSDQIGHLANAIVCSKCGIVELVNLSPSTPT
jgi:ribosomal protein L37AE/L43A